MPSATLVPARWFPAGASEQRRTGRRHVVVTAARWSSITSSSTTAFQSAPAFAWPGVSISAAAHSSRRALRWAPRVSIGEGTIVGAGAVVVSDLPAHVLAYGVPARGGEGAAEQRLQANHVSSSRSFTVGDLASVQRGNVGGARHPALDYPLRPLVGRFEILLVNDCSTDETGVVADAVAREFPEVRVIHNTRNLRQGGCLRMAFALARYDLVTHNAVDYPFDFADLPIVLKEFPAPTLSSSRGSRIRALRRCGGSFRGQSVLDPTLFGLRLDDYNFVQVYKRQFLMNDESFSTATAFITVERILRAHHAGRGSSQSKPSITGARRGHRPPATGARCGDSLRDIARLWLELRRDGRRVKHKTEGAGP